MELGLSGEVAIVIGGSAGIGLACAIALHEEGVSIAIVAHDRDRLAGAERAIGERSSRAGSAEVLIDGGQTPGV